MEQFQNGMQEKENQPTQFLLNNKNRRFTVSSLWSKANENDDQINDELTQAQRKLKDLKGKISSQSKKNFLLEKDVRYLDSRIALLIQNRMALDDEFMQAETEELDKPVAVLEDKKKQLYANLFFLLQTDPRLIANLTRLITLSEMDTLLQTVMFTLYGNQYEPREEHLLLTMFQDVLKSQVDDTSDFGSLLRANTPVSRMMTTYTRRGPGQQYLKLVLSENINKLLEGDEINLEINPLKVYEELHEEGPGSITLEEAAQDSRVKKLIQPRAAKLIQIANEFLQTIFASLDSVPYGIRWICKQIRDLTQKKFPEASDWSICSLIGGFFFLRFINPAIITPQSYMIVETGPSNNPRRTLTMIAKMIQHLANKPSYSKESHMMLLQPFVEQNKELITQFLHKICQVDDFYQSLEMDQYLALSKKDLSIQISLNELYNTHSLFAQHIETICPADLPNLKPNPISMSPQQSFHLSCHQLKQILIALGPSPGQLSRKENRTFPLFLFSKSEMAPVLFPSHVFLNEKIESVSDDDVQSASDILFMDTKNLIIQVIRKQAIQDLQEPQKKFLFLPPISIQHIPGNWHVIHIEEILEKALQYQKDSLMKQKALRAKQNLLLLQQQFQHPFVKIEDGYQKLSQCIFEEFKSLFSLRSKIKYELESLEMVFKTICDHNRYLKSQLESYKAYLQNVRIQAGGGQAKGSFMVGVTPAASQQPEQKPKSNYRMKAATLTKSSSQNSNTVIKFTHFQLEKEGVILESGVPENRRQNIYIAIQSPIPGTFIIGLHYKGREKPLVEVDLKLDDLLEKQQDKVQHLDLEYVRLHVNKMLFLLNKTFIKPSLLFGVLAALERHVLICPAQESINPSFITVDEVSVGWSDATKSPCMTVDVGNFDRVLLVKDATVDICDTQEFKCFARKISKSFSILAFQQDDEEFVSSLLNNFERLSVSDFEYEPNPGFLLKDKSKNFQKQSVELKYPELYKEFISIVSGDLPVPSNKQLLLDQPKLLTRYSFSPENVHAQQYLADYLESTGLKVSLHTFRIGRETRNNVIAELKGKKPDLPEIYICAHYDDTSEIPYKRAPGAIDDGSGTAGVLQLAYEISKMEQLERTIKFIFFSGEEQGIIGSSAFVKTLSVDRVYAAICMDMIGYSRHYFGVKIEGTSNRLIRKLMKDLDESFAKQSGLEVVKSERSFGSDHVSFQRRGIPAVLLIEKDDTNYPFYHSSKDTAENLNEKQALSILTGLLDWIIINARE